MRLSFSGTNGVNIDSVTVTGANFSGSTTKNLTVQNSIFTGSAVFNYLANSNVLLTNNTHNNIEGGGQYSSPARIHLSYSSSTHSGVTIQNSVLDGGSADGVQTGVGVNIIGNVFKNIREGSCSDCHTDAIQLLGADGSVIRGNYLYAVASGIVAYDGVKRATIEDNIVDTGSRPWGIELYADDSSIVRHNTLVYRANCAWNLPCGTISLDRKSADPAGKGTIVVDNIATSIAAINGSTYAERNHNLLRSGATERRYFGEPDLCGRLDSDHHRRLPARGELCWKECCVEPRRKRYRRQHVHYFTAATGYAVRADDPSHYPLDDLRNAGGSRLPRYALHPASIRVRHSASSTSAGHSSRTRQTRTAQTLPCASASADWHPEIRPGANTSNRSRAEPPLASR